VTVTSHVHRRCGRGRGGSRGARRQDGSGGLRFIDAGQLECLAASASYAISYIYMDKFLARQGMSPIALSACSAS